jgi:ABC-2 type transport system permease protein
MTQPKAVLPRLLAGESLAHGWGDLVRGAATLATLAGLDAARLPLTMLAVMLGVAVYVSAAVTFASLSFWIAGARSFARDLRKFLLLFSTFPGSIYSGATRLIAFTVLPAGFVVLAPGAFVREPTPAHLAVAVASAIGYAGLAGWYSVSGFDATNAARRRPPAPDLAPSARPYWLAWSMAAIFQSPLEVRA